MDVLLVIFGYCLFLVLISLLIEWVSRLIFKGRKSYKEDNRVFRWSVGVLLTFSIVAVIFYSNYSNINREKRANLAKAKILISKADWELYKWADGKEFNIEVLDQLRERYRRGRVRLYVEENEIPSDLKSLLTPDELPYISKTKFRILSIGSLEEKSFIFVREDGQKEDDDRMREINYNLK